MQAATDVDTDGTGKLLTRKGKTAATATAAHSIYANHMIALVNEGPVMKVRESNGTWSPLKTLQSSAHVSHETVLDTVYFSNGTDKGRIVNRTAREWGITPPVSQPVAVEGIGFLPAGRYMYALTFVRSDGHESGTGIAGEIELTGGSSAIVFSGIEVSTNPEISGKIVYISSTNGEILYRAISLPNNQTTASYARDGLDLAVPLITQFAGPPPTGHIVRVYNGVMYVAVGNVLYHSEPYAMELFKLDTSYMQFPGKITMFEAVDGGVFVATDDVVAEDQETPAGTWFLNGVGPGKFALNKLFDYGAFENSAVLTDAAYFESQFQAEARGSQAGPAVVWACRHGICLGRSGGAVQNLTEAVYSFPGAVRAAGMVRQHRGYVNYVVTLQGVGATNNKYVGG